jgi:hypothetical protein
LNYVSILDIQLLRVFAMKMFHRDKGMNIYVKITNITKEKTPCKTECDNAALRLTPINLS